MRTSTPRRAPPSARFVTRPMGVGQRAWQRGRANEINRNGRGSTMSDISRRSFVSGFAASAIALAGGTAAFADEAATTAAPLGLPEAWDYETDVVVCGYGPGGGSAAYEACIAGCDVILIDKSTLPGGSMARCGGTINGAGTKVQADAGIEDSADELYKWLSVTTEGYPTDEILMTYINNCGPNVDWYQELAIEYTGEEIFVPEIREGMKNGINVTITSGAMEQFGFTADELPPRSHWARCYDDSATCSGPELYNVLYQATQAQPNFQSMQSTALKSLVRDQNGMICGVRAEQDGKEIYLKARKGVVVATGGFGSDPEMKKKFCPEGAPYESFMNPNCTGDGIRALMDVGADLTQMSFYKTTAKYDPSYSSEWDGVFEMWLTDEEHPNVMINRPETSFTENHGGVVINTNGQVLNVWGEPIPRLYAAGCDTGSNIFGGPSSYPGCGTYVANALCFGRLAGQHIATLENWE